MPKYKHNPFSNKYICHVLHKNGLISKSQTHYLLSNTEDIHLPGGIEGYLGKLILKGMKRGTLSLYP